MGMLPKRLKVSLESAWWSIRVSASWTGADLARRAVLDVALVHSEHGAGSTPAGPCPHHLPLHGGRTTCNEGTGPARTSSSSTSTLVGHSTGWCWSPRAQKNKGPGTHREVKLQ